MSETIEQETAHRPWPLPTTPWIMFQSWRELLFAHWRVPTDVLRALVPAQLELDQFEGSAWLALTPFLLSDLHARGLPPIPGLSEFPEMNLRTYVRYGGRPGIFFFSLDAANAAAVLTARATYRLPYQTADMRMRWDRGWFHYTSRRRDGDAEFVGRYRAIGEAREPVHGTLEYFLTERYALYSVLRNGRVLRGQIHHRPWLLQDAEAEIQQNTVPAAHGISVSQQPELLHFSSRQDTLVWPPEILS